jgi:class 3 adenylate cyclase
MRFYNDLEIDLLIEEIREAAHEAIEQAAGEAARAAFIESVERKAKALQAAEHWQMEAQKNLQAVKELRKARVKNILLAGLICFFGGFAVGIVIR